MSFILFDCRCRVALERKRRKKKEERRKKKEERSLPMVLPS
jgi:thymidylate kinase